MESKKFHENEISDLREKITGQVINEILENRRREYEKERIERENHSRLKAQKQKELLDKMQSQYPLYGGSPASSLYVEKYGTHKIHPFRKCTKFSKPISEQWIGPFKPE